MYSNIIIRHSAPSKLDHAPWGTSCKVFNKSGSSFELFKQYGHQENDPQWTLMGTFEDSGLDSHIIESLKS